MSLACFRDYSRVLAPGERVTLPVIAADRYQARDVFGYITALVEGVPMLAQLVERKTQQSIELPATSVEIRMAWRRRLDSERPLTRVQQPAGHASTG